MTEPTKNPAPNKTNSAKAPADPYESWEEESTGFPPYFEPGEGRHFMGMPIEVDDTDPDFRRYLLVAGEDVQCFRGPKDDQTEVIVKKGEHFTVGDYYNLPLYKYANIMLRVACKEKIETKSNRTVWTFSVKMSPEDKKMLAAAETSSGPKKLPPSRYASGKDAPEGDAVPAPFR